jgi:hypothetical protein
VSFAAITLCVASQLVFIVVYFVINSIRKLLDIPSYMNNVDVVSHILCELRNKRSVADILFYGMRNRDKKLTSRVWKTNW